MSDDTPNAAPLDAPGDTTQTTPAERRAAIAAPPDPGFPDGYVRLEEVGRGGMGVVYRATETDLRRDVAVKLLLDRFQTGGAVAKRFLEEAQIAARLQHPGVPPVYRVGVLPSGRPFMVMKLVKGARGEKPPTLANLLNDRKSLAQDRLRFIHIFWQVCQSVGYAHERNVIHRDLKPSNVMVGAFGEVQVMDWGLGKVLEDSEPGEPAAKADPLTCIYSPRDPGAPGTQYGAVQGTPEFMSPEQALGENDEIGAPADVFSLGAILCVILTGLPPYQGANALAHAAAWKVEKALARLDGCGADPELIALTKWCLARQPRSRPASAADVAKAVAEWRVAADARAQNAVIGEHTRELYLLALDGFDKMVTDIRAKLVQRPGTLDLQEHALRVARSGLQKLLGEAQKRGTPDRALLWTHFQIGSVDLALGKNEEALREYERGNLLAESLADANPGDVQARRDMAVSFFNLGDATLKLGRGYKAQRFYERGRELAQKLADERPDDLQSRRDVARVLEKLSDAMLALGQDDEAREFHQRAHNVWLRLAGRHPSDPQTQRDLIANLNRWGAVSRGLNRMEEARSSYEQAQELLQRLAEQYPDDPQIQRDLMSGLGRLGEIAEANRELIDAAGFYERALAVARRCSRPELFAADVSALGERLARCSRRLGDTVEMPALPKGCRTGFVIRQRFGAGTVNRVLQRGACRVARRR